MNWTIEKDVPLPAKPAGRHTAAYPGLFEKLRECEVGDSVGGIPEAAVSNAQTYMKDTHRMTFTRRREGATFRLWRTA